MYHEAKYDPKTAQELYDRLPVIQPTSTYVMKPKLDGFGQHYNPTLFTITEEDWKGLPEWNWWDIFGMVGMKLPAQPLTKKELKAEKDKLWEEFLIAEGPFASNGARDKAWWAYAAAHLKRTK
jgi:hypothetical protein